MYVALAVLIVEVGMTQLHGYILQKPSYEMDVVRVRVRVHLSCEMKCMKARLKTRQSINGSKPRSPMPCL